MKNYINIFIQSIIMSQSISNQTSSKRKCQDIVPESELFQVIPKKIKYENETIPKHLDNRPRIFSYKKIYDMMDKRRFEIMEESREIINKTHSYYQEREHIQEKNYRELKKKYERSLEDIDNLDVHLLKYIKRVKELEEREKEFQNINQIICQENDLLKRQAVELNTQLYTYLIQQTIINNALNNQ